MGWPSGTYGAILADPPWRYMTWSAKGTGRSAEQHYQTMGPDEIRALPVGALAAPDCALLLWATFPNLPLALDVIGAWGFTYKTAAFVWAKTARSQANSFAPKHHIGLGHWTRANAELCLLATKGHPTRLDKGVRQLIVSPVRQHSRKPDEQYERIERLVAGPYLELFARQRRPGWDAWGDEAPDVARFA
jgi:N6-adenosine-specific RNA methylase IME4